MAEKTPEELCVQCQGECCKSYPGGATLPEDFEDEAAMAKALESGRYTIDCWEGDPRPIKDKKELHQADYIRPAIKGKEGRRIDRPWGGECTFLTKTGCELAPDKRPSGCRMLEARPDGNCIVHGADKRRASIAWLKHRDFLNQAKSSDMED